MRHPDRFLVILTAAAALWLAGEAMAQGDACREWRREHESWKIETLRRHLHGAPQRAVDEAVFELLQREAYLTACPTSAGQARVELVGWRLVDRAPEAYASAVAESLLEQAGFDLSLAGLFEGRPGARLVQR
jgi:hypothetical protein